ncbi:MAG: transglycosylase SLT domain-containing protein [Planctomycetota bacterium]
MSEREIPPDTPQHRPEHRRQRQTPPQGDEEATRHAAGKDPGARPSGDPMGWLPFAQPGSPPSGDPPPAPRLPPDPDPVSFSPLAETVGSPVLPFPGEARARRTRLPQGRLWALALLTASVVGWSLWPTARSLAVEVRDGYGMQLVEGHLEIIVASAHESRVDPSLLAAIMFIESHGRGGQTSNAGALGLMQLVPASASDAARRLDLPAPTTDQLLENDELNVRLGAAHLAWLLEHRGDWSLEQVLVSYNAGRARLLAWMERHGGYAGWRVQEEQEELAGRRTSGALRYALGVLDARERLLERGVIPGPGPDATHPAGG